MRGITLDHVAVALHRWRDGFPRFVGTLGGRWVSGGYAPEFCPSQYRFGNDARLELLMPGERGGDDFVRRFLASNGPGPHHLTFKVDDIEEAIGQIRDAGIEPYGVNLADPTWQEAFIHPKAAALGLVVQVAQTDQPLWETAPPRGYPADLPEPAELRYVAHAVADLDATRRVFEDLLRGRRVDEGADEAARWVELAWPDPSTLRLRLLEPTTPDGPIARWLAGRAGRVHHLAFAGASLPGGARELDPDDATGTRVVALPG